MDSSGRAATTRLAEALASPGLGAGIQPGPECARPQGARRIAAGVDAASTRGYDTWYDEPGSRTAALYRAPVVVAHAGLGAATL